MWAPSPERILGVDAAEELVLQFVDRISARGQSDIVASAKVSIDAAAVLVRDSMGRTDDALPPHALGYAWESVWLSASTVLLMLSPSVVVYLADDVRWDEEIVSDVVRCMKDFCGEQRVRAGLSSVAGSPIIGWL